jgi:hypothetical protein
MHGTRDEDSFKLSRPIAAVWLLLLRAYNEFKGPLIWIYPPKKMIKFRILLLEGLVIWLLVFPFLLSYFNQD